MCLPAIRQCLRNLRCTLPLHNIRWQPPDPEVRKSRRWFCPRLTALLVTVAIAEELGEYNVKVTVPALTVAVGVPTTPAVTNRLCVEVL